MPNNTPTDTPLLAVFCHRQWRSQNFTFGELVGWDLTTHFNTN